MPYVRESDDRLHQLVQIEIILILLIAYILQKTQQVTLDASTDATLSALLIIITLAISGVFAGMLLIHTPSHAYAC